MPYIAEWSSLNGNHSAFSISGGDLKDVNDFLMPYLELSKQKPVRKGSYAC